MTATRPTPHEQQLACIRRSWIDFCKFSERVIDLDDPFAVIPDEAILNGFLYWCTEMKVGFITDRISTRTLAKYVDLVSSYVTKRHSVPLTKVRREKARHFVDEKCVPLGASRQCRPRPVASPEVVNDLVHFLWALDESDLHPRSRFQFSAIVLILMFHGVRPGELVESTVH